MYILQRFTALINASIQFIGMLVLYYQPKFIYDNISLEKAVTVIVSVMFITLLGSLFIIGKKSKLKQKIHLGFFLFISWAAALSIFLFNDRFIIAAGLMVLLPVMHLIWLETLFFFWQQPISYQPYTLQKLAGYLYLLTIFLVVVSLTGLMIYMQWPFYIIWPCIGLIIWLLHFDLMLLQSFEKDESIVFSTIGTTIGMQLYLILHLLPGNFFLYGAILTLFFYVWFGIIKLYQQRKKQKKQFYSFISISVIGAIIVIYTTFWIK